MYPENLKYTAEHEWVRDDGGELCVGITDFAAERLGDITYVELPEVGSTLGQGDEAGAVESVKAASDIYAPVAGTVSSVNPALEERPELVNESPYDEGWFFKVKAADSAQLDGLMDAASYALFVKEQDH